VKKLKVVSIPLEAYAIVVTGESLRLDLEYANLNAKYVSGKIDPKFEAVFVPSDTHYTIALRQV
jgi:hypothetical protein